MLAPIWPPGGRDKIHREAPMRTLLLVTVTGVSFFVAAAGGQTPAANQGAPFQKVGSLSQLMIDIIYPASDAVFYIARMPPQNEKEWNDFKGQALMLAESGNLLMMEG